MLLASSCKEQIFGRLGMSDVVRFGFERYSLNDLFQLGQFVHSWLCKFFKWHVTAVFLGAAYFVLALAVDRILAVLRPI